MKTNPLAQKKNIQSSDLNGMTAVIFNGVHFDDWQRVVRAAVGETIDLNFHLSSVESLQNISLTNLGDMIYICGFESVLTYFQHRSDVVIFDTLDGKEMLMTDTLAYLASNKEAHLLAKAMKQQLENLMLP